MNKKIILSVLFMFFLSVKGQTGDTTGMCGVEGKGMLEKLRDLAAGAKKKCDEQALKNKELAAEEEKNLKGKVLSDRIKILKEQMAAACTQKNKPKECESMLVEINEKIDEKNILIRGGPAPDLQLTDTTSKAPVAADSEVAETCPPLGPEMDKYQARARLNGKLLAAFHKCYSQRAVDGK